MMARKILIETATENNTYNDLIPQKKLLVTVHALTLYITRIKNKVLK